MAISLLTLSTEDLLEKLKEAGIHVTEDEARKFRGNWNFKNCENPFDSCLIDIASVARPNLLDE